MRDFSSAVLMLRYGASSFIHQLECLPPDRLNWRPRPTAKSALEISAEVAGALFMYLPMLRGTDWEPVNLAVPTNLDEARALITSAVENYVTALLGAGPELARAQDMPFGATFWAPHAALFPVMEVQHHHGQLCYIQTLLGDAEMHWDEGAIREAFVYRPASD